MGEPAADFGDMEISEEEKQMLAQMEEEASQPETPEEPQVAEESTQPEQVKEPEQPEESPRKDTPEEQIEKLTRALNGIRAENRQLTNKLSSVDEIKNEILRIREERNKPEPEQIPDYNEDPLGNLQATLKQYDERFSQQSQQLESMQTQGQYLQLAQQVNNFETSFRTSNPDYDQALTHLREIRKGELELFGITDERQIEAELQSNARNIAISALQQGKNPAEVIYGLAQKYGYRKPDVAKKQETVLDTIAEGQKTASRTLSKSGEAEKNGTLESLLSADGDDFDRQWAELFDR